MKRIAVLSLVCASFGVLYGQETKRASSTTADEIRQLERDWTDATKARDTDKLSQILADDWRSLSFDGSILTKKKYLGDLKAGMTKLESFEFGPMDVKVIGPVAVVQGSDTEKSQMSGKDTTGKWVWMDVFAKRNGKWQVVRSQAAKLP